MQSMDYRPPSVNQPSTGIGLLPRTRLLALRQRYERLLRRFALHPVAAYFSGVITDIDRHLSQKPS